MDLGFTHKKFTAENDELLKTEDIKPVSKSSDVDEAFFSDVVQIIDEKGNEINCTVYKFIEIFDNIGLEGFIL